MNKTIFAHLYKHARLHKAELDKLLAMKSRQMVERDISSELGALDCLYWQALGMGELLLAKHIRRLIDGRYQQHRLLTVPSQYAAEQAAA